VKREPWPRLSKNSPEDLRRLTQLLAQGYGGQPDERFAADAEAGGWTLEEAMELAHAARKQEALDQLAAQDAPK
jgi:NTP pyrophosphatase (non-canonical NTP hydrolase)